MNEINPAHEQFEKENGMSLDEAWNYVQKWKFEGKKEEAIRGCKEILKFFPDHEGAKTTLHQLGGMDSRIEQFSGEMIDKVGEKIKEVTHQAPKDPELLAQEKARKKEEAETEEQEIAEAQEKLTTNEERLWGALSYCWVLVFLPIIFKRNTSLFIKFHARQGLVIFLIFFFFEWLIISLLSLIFGGPLAMALDAVIFILFVGLAIMAYQGNWFKIPVVYKLSKKIPL